MCGCVVWCGVVWCGVVWCGVVWCGVVWCGVVCASVSVQSMDWRFEQKTLNYLMRLFVPYLMQYVQSL